MSSYNTFQFFNFVTSTRRQVGCRYLKALTNASHAECKWKHLYGMFCSVFLLSNFYSFYFNKQLLLCLGHHHHLHQIYKACRNRRGRIATESDKTLASLWSMPWLVPVRFLKTGVGVFVVVVIALREAVLVAVLRLLVDLAAVPGMV